MSHISPLFEPSDHIDATVYHIPNGNDYHIAEVLELMVRRVQPFGCADVRDYVKRRVLAYRTPDATNLMMWGIAQAKPDMVYVESGYNIDPRALAHIRDVMGIPVTMWFGDACIDEAYIDRLSSYAAAVSSLVARRERAVRAPWGSHAWRFSVGCRSTVIMNSSLSSGSP